MLAVAVAGLLANVIAFFVLNGGNRENLNMRSAWLHVLGDILGFVVAIAAAGVILWTGWSPIDPLLSIVVALLILKSAYDIVRSSSHILPGRATGQFRPCCVVRRSSICNDQRVLASITVIARSLTAEQPLVTLHVRCPSGGKFSATLISTINDRLKKRFGITHSTIQVETGECKGDENHR